VKRKSVAAAGIVLLLGQAALMLAGPVAGPTPVDTHSPARENAALVARAPWEVAREESERGG